jgi:hypothetical protein
VDKPRQDTNFVDGAGKGRAMPREGEEGDIADDLGHSPMNAANPSVLSGSINKRS